MKNGPELIRSRVAEHLGVRLTPGQVSQQHAKSYGPVPPGPPWYESLSVWIAGGALAIALLLAWLPRIAAKPVSPVAGA